MKQLSLNIGMELTINKLIEDFKKLLDHMSLNEKIDAINEIRYEIHKLSPFKENPVDYVKWVLSDNVVANDYNPNKVAPPEMELLELSIINDGYTQPIVTWDNLEKNKTEVIDGFHRNRVGKESKIVSKRIFGYLPIVDIRKEQSDKNDRIASTIRHNRARGKHMVNAMSEIVIELKNRNWTNQRIAKQLGMDEEEVLRLCQISGLEHLFTDADFSKAWESSDYQQEYEILNDNVDDVINNYKIPNENDVDRIFHTYDKWECYPYGFYDSKKDGMKAEECELAYANFFKTAGLFERVLNKLIIEWKYSCEHYLTNKSMNRIAWLGQASVCYELGIPSKYCSGWNLLTEDEQNNANLIALKALNKWLIANNRQEIELNEALSIGRQTELY
jgi:ParB-like chromosome segregation protein Spo0J